MTCPSCMDAGLEDTEHVGVGWKTERMWVWVGEQKEDLAVGWRAESMCGCRI